VEGVLQSAVSLVGIFSNLTFCYILTRRKMLNCFNLLLVSLAAFDTWYTWGQFYNLRKMREKVAKWRNIGKKLAAKVGNKKMGEMGRVKN
jgi:hypothetical protein